jgi:cell wall integrity and stress response component
LRYTTITYFDGTSTLYSSGLATSTSPPTDSASGSTKLGGGAIAGIAVGSVTGVVVFALLFMICLRRRGHSDESPDTPFDSVSKRSSSLAGIMGSSRRETIGERYANGRDGRQMAENWESSPHLSSKRRSHLMPVDPRLDYAKGMYVRNENQSHESFSSLQDNQDYSRPVHQPSRVLRVTNPEGSGVA